jgi:hypothetical protein
MNPRSSILAEEPASQATSQAASWPGIRSLLVPSIPDIFFVVLIVIVFMAGSGWSMLLGDGDTGWHIRTGEFILQHHNVPTRDLFSYTVPDTPWYAWEWLADIIFAGVHRLAGLKGVVLFSGTVACLAVVILFRHMIWRGAGVHVALFVGILAADALRFHFLARPHIFTTLLTAVTLWMLDRDSSNPCRAVWALIPITILWTNLHGGFLVLITAVIFFAAGALIRRETARALRYGILAASCSAASLVNPYGWNLHAHIWNYLRSDWLITSIVEFQSPVFRSEPMARFEVLLFLGLVCVLDLIRRKRYETVFLILFLAHSALTSVRHVTIFVIAAAPAIALQLSNAWEHWVAPAARASIAGILRDFVHEMRTHSIRTSIWIPAFVALLAFSRWGLQYPSEFPPATFPATLFARNAALLTAPGNENSRILNPDGWGGYLIYKLYPGRRVFIDGRSDYYGSAVFRDYVCLRAACENWQDLANQYRFQFAFIPPDWALSRALRQSNQWVLRDQDKVALLFERRRAGDPGTGAPPTAALR